MQIHSQNFRLFKDFRIHSHRPQIMLSQHPHVTKMDNRFHSFLIVTYILYLHILPYSIIPRNWGQRKININISHSKIPQSIKGNIWLNNIKGIIIEYKNKMIVCRNSLFRKLRKQSCKISLSLPVLQFSWRGQRRLHRQSSL